MTEETVKLELDKFTAKFIELWYSVLKKPLAFDSIDEFLMYIVRYGTTNYRGRVSPEKMKQFTALYETSRGEGHD